MQAISKANHEKFCKLMKDIITRQDVPVNDLIELESEFHNAYKEYQQGISDLKMIKLNYDVKQQSIRNRMKQLLHK